MRCNLNNLFYKKNDEVRELTAVEIGLAVVRDCVCVGGVEW